MTKITIAILQAAVIFLGYSTSLWASDPNLVKPIESTPIVRTVTVPHPSIVNAEYQNLPVCPNDHNLPNPGPPVCPDINGNLPDGVKVANCPEYCQVNRKIQMSGSTIMAVYSPVCPEGYAQLASFNMQPEYEYGYDTVNPPISHATYLKLMEAGYNCWPTTQSGNVRHCHRANNYDKLFTPGTNANVDNNAVRINSIGEPSECYNLDISGVGKCDVLSGIARDGKLCRPDYMYDRITNYSYLMLACTSAHAIHETQYRAPATRVCGRAKDVWKPLNPMPKKP